MNRRYTKINSNKKIRTLVRLLAGLLVTVFLAVPWLYQRVSAQAGSLTVNQSDDAGDGVCDSTCTLRDAVIAANTTPGTNTINFDSALTTVTLDGEIFVAGGGGALIINGNGANSFTIDGGPNSNRIFYLNVADVTITRVTLTGGEGGGTFFANWPGTDGGAVAGYASTVLLDGVHVTGNSPDSDGGGISLQDGHLRIRNSTISYNVASSCGGIMVGGPGSTLQVVNSTISGNWATSGVGVGGGVCTSAAAAFRNVTITENRANRGGGIVQADGTLSLANTIVAVNTADLSFSEIFLQGGTLNSTGSNLIGDSPGDATSTSQPTMYQGTDILDTPPMLFPWGYYGGPTPTHAVQSGSPLIDTGSQAFAVDFDGTPLQWDQRGNGFPRVVGNQVDIGAFEAQAPPPTPTPTPEPATSFAVNSANDPGTGVCDGTECTLREAIAAANSDEGAETITFDSAAFAASGAYTINLSAALPNLSSDITIQGPGANILTVRRDTGGSYRIFTISALATVSISGLTISDGRVNGVDLDANGGGILNEGTLTLENSTVRDNEAFFCGGGVCNWGQFATAHVINSNILNNKSKFNGGGLENRGTMTVQNSTVSGNSSYWDGGGLQNAAFTASCSVTNSVISDNHVGGWGGGIANGASLVLMNSTVSGNSAAMQGGGILNEASLEVVSATITNNRSDADDSGGETGGGFYNYRDTAPVLRNTIVAGNYRGVTSTTSDDINFRSVFSLHPSSSFNLIGTGGSGGLADGINYNYVDIPDPGLGPLQNNGGLTETHALLAGSLAIDKGSNFGAVADQRGSPRPFDIDSVANAADGSDIGAYESNFTPFTPKGTNVTVSTGSVSVTYTAITQAGETTITEIDPATAGTLPGSYSLGLGLPAYEITTTAVYTPPITVCFYLPGITDEATFNTLRILHGEGGSLVDRTIIPPNFATKTICGSVTSLSPFVVAEYEAPEPTPTPTPEARKFDEYGNISFNDEDAILDNYFIALQNEPGSTGTIIVYGSYVSEAQERGDRARDYLVNARGIEAGRVTVLDGGCRSALTVQLWLVPQGADEPTVDTFGTISPCPAGPTPTPTPMPNTIPGTDVEVADGAVAVVFSEVSLAGETTVTEIDPATAGTMPGGYSLGEGLPAYEITTTARYTPPITVCIQVSGVSDPHVFAALRILHGEGGMLVDRTILPPDSPAPDFATRTLCARVDSLSPFVVAQLLNPAYNFSGFLKPIENLPALNIAPASSSIPVKFSLGRDQGLNIFASGYPVSSPIACDASEPGVVIEESVAAGNSSLSYNSTTDQYTYVWKTEKAWKGTCRMLIVRFNDSSEHYAKFRFK